MEAQPAPVADAMNINRTAFLLFLKVIGKSPLGTTGDILWSTLHSNNLDVPSPGSLATVSYCQFLQTFSEYDVIRSTFRLTTQPPTPTPSRQLVALRLSTTAEALGGGTW